MVDSSGQEMGLHSNSRAGEIVGILLYFIIGRDLIKGTRVGLQEGNEHGIERVLMVVQCVTQN